MRKLKLLCSHAHCWFLPSGDFHRKHSPVLCGKVGVWLISVSWACVMTPGLSLRSSCWGKWLITFNQNEISTADLCHRLVLYAANNNPVYPYLTRMPWDATAQLLPGHRHSTGSCCVHLNTSLYIIYLDLSLSHTHTFIHRYIYPLKSVFSSSMKSELISETVILCSDCCERCLALRFEKSEASFFSRKADGILVKGRARSCDKKAVFLCHYLKVLIFSLPENCHTNWEEKITNIYFRKLFVWNTRLSWPRCNLK